MADMITRTLKRREVRITNPVDNTELAVYNVSRATTPEKELVKYIKKGGALPAIATVEEVEERREMSLETFLQHSEIVTEEEAV